MKRTPLWIWIAVILISPFVEELGAQTFWYSYGGNPLAYGVLDPAVLYDSVAGEFAMWYAVPNSGVKKGISFDGSNWYLADRVVLSPGDVGAFDRMIHSVSVVKSGDTYLMYYTASRNSDSLTIGLATSQDGESWYKHPDSPVLTHGPALSWEARSVSGAEVWYDNGIFKMLYGGTDNVLSHTGIATSIDGVNWAKDPRNPVLRCGDAGAVDATAASVVGIASREGVLYMLYRSIDGGGYHSYSLATSPDGLDWTKWAENPVKRGNGWDSYWLGGGTLIYHKDLFRFWYCGSYAPSSGSWGFGEAISRYTGLSTGAPSGGLIPDTYTLSNYPNPFNPSTTIRFGLPTAARVRLTIFNVLGQEVATLADDEYTAGYHEVRLDGSELPSGAYYYQFKTDESVQTRRIVLLK